MTVGTTACESMIAAGNVFLGLAEAPLVIRPYIKDLVTFIILCVGHQALHDIEWPFNPITTLTSAVFFIMEFNAQKRLWTSSQLFCTLMLLQGPLLQ